MLYIPDLFSAYAEGQEKAIDRNWNDLNQYETVEQARTANDLAKINLQANMDDYGNNRAVSQALGTQAQIGEDLLNRSYVGEAANADMNSLMATSQLGAFNANLPAYDTYTNSVLSSNLGVGTNNAAAAQAYSNVTANNLPQTLTAFDGAQQAQNIIAGQNNVSAPLINAATNANNLAALDLNGQTIQTGAIQNANTQALLPLTHATQVAALQQGQEQIAQTEQARVAQEKQRVAATIDNLRTRISNSSAQIVALRAEVLRNPTTASAYNRQIILLTQSISQDQDTLKQIEAKFGSYGTNTVQSLMGN